MEKKAKFLMTYVRYAILGVVAVVFITIALANREIVTVALLPDTLAAMFGFNLSITLPLFLIVGGAVIIGLLLGFFWEWLRERGYRSEAVKARREVDILRSELGHAKAAAPKTQTDDVLALLDNSAGAR
jgi:putative membrane protein